MSNNIMLVPQGLSGLQPLAPSNAGNADFVVPPQQQDASSGPDFSTDAFVTGNAPDMVVPPQRQVPEPGAQDASPVPPPGAPPKLQNEGGKVLAQAAYVPLYLGDYWATAQGAQDEQAMNGFAQEFGTSAMADVLKQYGVGPASFGGSANIPGAVPATVTNADVQKMVQQALASGKVKPNAQGIYTVFLPPGTVLQSPSGHNSKQGLGGYHSSYLGPDGKPVYYAAIVYSQKGNGIDFTGDPQKNDSITASHEWTEAQTDPDVNSPAGLPIGWYDRTNNAEIGDLAIEQLPLAKTFQQDAAGKAVQLEWSNQDGAYEIAPASAHGGTAPNKTTGGTTPGGQGVVLPPAPNRPPGTTEIEGIFTINKYDGLQHGRNGTHEIADATLTTTNAVAKPGVVDTQNVRLAMNVASSKDPAGLPKEIPLKPGQQIEVEGEYIPASKANANGEAVVHFTHNPLGYVIINGQQYS